MAMDRLEGGTMGMGLTVDGWGRSDVYQVDRVERGIVHGAVARSPANTPIKIGSRARMKHSSSGMGQDTTQFLSV